MKEFIINYITTPFFLIIVALVVIGFFVEAFHVITGYEYADGCRMPKNKKTANTNDDNRDTFHFSANGPFQFTSDSKATGAFWKAFVALFKKHFKD